jgi:hypothetical protein
MHADRRTTCLALRLAGRRLAVAAGLALTPALAVALAPRTVAAQQRAATAPQLEGRLDAVLSPVGGAVAGIGVNVRAGWYARVGLAVSAGAVNGSSGLRSIQRVDGTARFLFDPFAEGRRAFYAGAGLGAQHSSDSGDVQGFLLGVVGVEGRAAGRIVPSFELTVGGGARLGVVLRARRARGR